MHMYFQRFGVVKRVMKVIKLNALLSRREIKKFLTETKPI